MPATRIRPGVRPLAPLAIGLLLLALVAIGGSDAASAQSAKTIGKTKRTPAPACPKGTCEAVGSVTGFQVVGDGRKNLFRARENGRLVAWAIRLSKPTKKQRNFFGNFYENTRFGKRPTARIAVLRRMGGRKFKLLRQSPPVDLTSGLGAKQTYTLTQPLKIRRGQILALTLPTWAPSFAVNLRPRRNIWRASRRKGKCVRTRHIKNGRPHQKVDSTRVYGCSYRTARLLYWGFYVPR